MRAKSVSLELRFFLILVFFTFFQDFIFATIYKFNIVNATVLKLLFALRDVIVIIFGLKNLLVLLIRKKVNVTDFVAILFLVVVVISAVFGEQDLFNKLLSSRVYIIPILLYFWGRNVKVNNENLKFIRHVLLLLTFFIVLSSLIERFLLPVDFWVYINLANFNSEVKGLTNLYSINELVGNFYTGNIRRAIGFAGDPLLLSYFLIPLFFFSLSNFFYNEKKKIFYLILTFGVLFVQVLTITRAVLIAQILSIIMFYIMYNIKLLFNKKVVTFFFLVGLGITFFIEKIWDIIYKTVTFNDGGSALTHLISFKTGLNTFLNNPLGLGIGTASTLVTAANGGFGSENSYFNLGIELGIIGLFIFLTFWIFTFYKIFINAKSNISNINKKIIMIFYISILLSSLAYMITGFASPQLWTMKTVMLYWFLVGICQNKLKGEI
ncbi:hypothetical protein ABEP13_08890 [Geobacillus stearothermophilus]|uniref:O-antigen ligase family protein n=1 Tax=Geobacillus stearothermophilus TaxID=1422 RepID=UPI003D1B6782